jgi:hypothetical protein
MMGKGTTSRNGKELEARVVELAEQLGLEAKTGVKATYRVWGTKRNIDVVIVQEKTGKSLGIECKYQGARETDEDKILAVIEDIKFWPIRGIMVIHGEGFSPGMQRYLMATGKTVWFDDLKDWLCLYFAL